MLIATEPTLIEGGLVVDDRGQLSFVNGLDLEGVKRLYLVSNHEKGFIRAWHGHRNEAKYVYMAKGAAIVATVEIETSQTGQGRPRKFTLSENRPAILFIPNGHYNGFKTLTDDALIMFFSTSTLDESLNDDIRLDPTTNWPEVWQVEYR